MIRISYFTPCGVPCKPVKVAECVPEVVGVTVTVRVLPVVRSIALLIAKVYDSVVERLGITISILPVGVAVNPKLHFS